MIISIPLWKESQISGSEDVCTNVSVTNSKADRQPQWIQLGTIFGLVSDGEVLHRLIRIIIYVLMTWFFISEYTALCRMHNTIILKYGHTVEPHYKYCRCKAFLENITKCYCGLMWHSWTTFTKKYYNGLMWRSMHCNLQCRCTITLKSSR